MSNTEMTSRFWDSAWGEVEDYGFADDISELAGFSIGDEVIINVDTAEDPTNPGSISGYEDDEGIILGFSQPREGGGPFNLPKTGHALYVSFDGNDPVIVDPADVEDINE